MKLRGNILAPAALALICGCVSLAATGLWLDVPYIHQEKDGCGSASLAMILRYWQNKGFPVDTSKSNAANIQKQLYSASSRGIYASEMEHYLREAGMDVFAFGGEWSDLRDHLSKGRPVIAGLKPKGMPAHYVVVVGIDPDDSGVLLNDPERGKLVRVERKLFEKAWTGTSHWTLLAVPHQPL